ncbi:hypothetical protein C1638_000905 [Chryseobacterium oncorhynchi]|uniref:Uncharacterized protein n=1 Tax=Chryseobacterium oncorhynchi TaxID=741074 RepID=A0A316X0L0_9FLAO|nr:hypothetical protein C1638_000905 [Chryseobacterium oncorhynchi]
MLTFNGNNIMEFFFFFYQSDRFKKNSIFFIQVIAFSLQFCSAFLGLGFIETSFGCFGFPGSEEPFQFFNFTLLLSPTADYQDAHYGAD